MKLFLRVFLALAVSVSLTIGIWMARRVPPTTREAAPQNAPTRARAVGIWQRTALVKYALIISVDGMRPDLLLRAQTPNMHKLMNEGSFTFWAQTTEVAITLPSHVSMLTGVKPERHKVDWNAPLTPEKQLYPQATTIFELAKGHGLTTALAAGKMKFAALAKPGTVDWLFLPKNDNGDDPRVAWEAAAIVTEHKPNLLFVHFPATDAVGHTFGWSSPQQMITIENADACVGTVLEAYKEANLLDQVFIVLTADHGGQGLSHGANDARSRHIPWITRGPGIRRGYDLTIIDRLNVDTEDTFATTAYLLGLPVERSLDGQPVLQILAQKELLTDRP